MLCHFYIKEDIVEPHFSILILNCNLKECLIYLQKHVDFVSKLKRYVRKTFMIAKCYGIFLRRKNSVVSLQEKGLLSFENPLKPYYGTRVGAHFMLVGLDLTVIVI